MKITQNTTISIGVFVALCALIVGCLTVFAPLNKELVFQKDLIASEKKSVNYFQSFCDRLDRLEKRIDKRFDRIEHKLDNL